MEAVTGQSLKSGISELAKQIVELCKDESEAVETSNGERKVAGQGSSINETLSETHHPRS